MKRNILGVSLTLLILTFFMSCSDDDDVRSFNTEAKIKAATVTHAEEILKADPLIQNDSVRFKLKTTPENFNFAPEFTLSEGATIDPESGTKMDFSNPQDYTVTSEDQQTSKTYTVLFSLNDTLGTQAKIISATIENINLLEGKPVIENDTVNLLLNQVPDNYYFAPEFTLSYGATLSPENGSEFDFSAPQQYTVTSEDGKATRTYTVMFSLSDALNSEALIQSATIPNAAELLEDEPLIENDSVKFELQHLPENFNFAPEFTLSSGASIDPENSTERDFTEPQEYTVTSEDQTHSTTYTVVFIVHEKVASTYSFENVEVIDTNNPEGHYDKFFEYKEDGTKNYLWASGNDGFNLMAATLVDEGEQLTPAFYPTAQTPNGYDGKALKLQTKSTGSLGAMVGSPLAAGNLYIGDFQMTFPTINSTKFGKPYPYDEAPVAFRGYFKYQAGDNFEINSDAGSELAEDTWDAYAILFRKTSGDDNYLPGDHNFDDSRIVSVAKLDDQQRIETDQWKAFYIPFEEVNGASFDSNQDYMFTIVLSSSKEGAVFNGAEGSTLWVDEMQLITKTE